MTLTAPPETTGPVALPRPAWNRHLLVLLVLTVALIPLPFLLPPASQAVAVRVLVFAIMAVGWNVMSGFGGMFSFGHAAYFGIGAYTSVWLLVEKGVSPWIGMAAGAVAAALFAALIGFLALRYKLKGAYFALSTFAFAEMLRLIAINSDLVNRAVGYNVPIRPESSVAFMQFEPGAPSYFWIALGLTVSAIAVSILFLRSRTGRFTVAVRDDEEAAAAVGIPVMRTKVTAMALSAAITSVAGIVLRPVLLLRRPGRGLRLQRLDPGDPAGGDRRGRHHLGPCHRCRGPRTAQRRDRHAVAQPS